jgi:MFS family permease
MEISEAQLEMRTRYRGGFYGQTVSGVLWLISASLSYWHSPRAGIIAIVFGGVLIFLSVEILTRLEGARTKISKNNTLNELGMQVAFVLPLSMPLLYPVAMFRLNWFYPALMILLGAHYLPFAVLYGMKMFLILAAVLIGAGMLIALSYSGGFSSGAWVTGVTLFLFAVIGRIIANKEYREDSE